MTSYSAKDGSVFVRANSTKDGSIRPSLYKCTPSKFLSFTIAACQIVQYDKSHLG